MMRGWLQLEGVTWPQIRLFITYLEKTLSSWMFIFAQSPFLVQVHFLSCCIFQTSLTMPSGSCQISTSHDYTLCNWHFPSSSSLVHHKKAIHPIPSSSLPEDGTKYVHVWHNHLTGESTISFNVTQAGQHELTSNFVRSTMCRGWLVLSQPHPSTDSRKTTWWNAR